MTHTPPAPLSQRERGEYLARQRTARERAQFILGAISLIVWFGLAFGLSIAWFQDEETAQPILMAGGLALMVAALPWLGYRRLVERLER